jgi:hypothetical protein
LALEGLSFSDLDAAISGQNQSQVGKLLREKAKLTRDQMVASMRERQAKARVAVAQLRVANLVSEMAQIDDRLAHWSTEIAVLNAAADLLIRAARQVVDRVMDDVFLAQRARESYQLEGTPNLRFDFGYLHPDTDRSLSPALRAASAWNRASAGRASTHLASQANQKARASARGSATYAREPASARSTRGAAIESRASMDAATKAPQRADREALVTTPLARTPRPSGANDLRRGNPSYLPRPRLSQESGPFLKTENDPLDHHPDDQVAAAPHHQLLPRRGVPLRSPR